MLAAVQINVPLPAGAIERASLGDIRGAFAEVYTKRYTSLYAGAAIEAISWRVRVLGPLPSVTVNETPSAPGGKKRKDSRQAWFGQRFIDHAVLIRAHRLSRDASVANVDDQDAHRFGAEIQAQRVPAAGDAEGWLNWRIRGVIIIGRHGRSFYTAAGAK